MKPGLSKHKLAAVGGVAAVLVGGGISIAAASPDSAPAPASSAAADEAGGEGADEQDPSYTGSVTAPAEPDGQEVAGDETQEEAALQPLATVTPQEAEQAAVAAVPGTVAQTHLGNENGFVVYSVEINAKDGTVTEVVVDAGNGDVLAQQAADGEESADQPEGPNDVQD